MREYLQKRANRLERRRATWAILRFIVVVDELNSAQDFYSLEKFMVDYADVQQILNENNPQHNNVMTAVRFCQIEHMKGICPHSLTPKEISIIKNWRKYDIDMLHILQYVLSSFECYWEKVLTSYKRVSARNNRLDYLIDYLTTLENKDYISPYKNIQEKIRELRFKYERQKD